MYRHICRQCAELVWGAVCHICLGCADLLPDLRHGLRHECANRNGDDADGLQQVVQDGCKTGAVCLVLRQNPRCSLVDVLVGTGNYLEDLRQHTVQLGLIQRDRIFSLSVLLPDKPGELVRVASVIAKAQGNVIKLDHNQFVSTNRNAAVELKITLEAFGTDHKNEIVKALEDAGCRPKVIRPSL